jgi:hypothetical protein
MISARLLLPALLAGAIVRAFLLPLPGTDDVRSWKSWSYQGARDTTGLYGVGGTPPDRGVIRWKDTIGTTEYPPLALYEMSAVGRIYKRIDWQYDDTPTLTALIKTPGLLAEVAFVIVMLTWGARAFGTSVARWIALAFWLNPAIVLNGAALGYLDAQMAVPAALALVAVGLGWPVIGGVLAAAAVLTKAQALFVMPAIALALLRQDRLPWRSAALRFSAAGAVTAAALILPFALRGALPNMIRALGRLGAHDMLSGYALNVWWIVTWLVRSTYALELGWFDAFTMEVRILGGNRFMALGFPDPKPIGAAVVIALTAWGAWRVRRSRTLDAWLLFAGWVVLAYFMFGAQVHENHAYLAVPCLAVAAGLNPRWRPFFWIVSALVAFNMYVFYGLGAGWPPIVSRTWTVIDLTVLASCAALAVFAYGSRRLARVGERP